MQNFKFCFLLLIFLHPLATPQLEEEEVEMAEVITESSPCSATCGLGLRTQMVCLLKSSKAAMEVKVQSGDEAEVVEKCRLRTVQCMDTWQCGLQTITVTSGGRVEVDCLGDAMEAMGRFSWRVSWRYARGIISSDDSLFALMETLELDRVVLDPVREEDAGTYRCDVLDATYRRVKRASWGIRVLPIGLLNLDYQSSNALWDKDKNTNTEEQEKISPYVFLVMGISAATAGFIVALLRGCEIMKRRRNRREI